MLRYKKKVDYEAVFAQSERWVRKWRELDHKIPEEIKAAFDEKLLISLIYHDAALEGEVLSHSEIKASIDKSIISDTSLIPSYEAINNFNNACRLVKEMAGGRRKTLKIDAVKDVHGTLVPGGGTYRKENPLHRLYYHDIAPPEKISYRMRKLGEWLDKPETKVLHPADRAAQLHWQLMGIFPWSEGTGRSARIVSNLVLALADYPFAVIHSIDRQRYYESLKATDHRQLLLIYLEAVETTARAALRVYDAAWKRGKKGRRRAS